MKHHTFTQTLLEAKSVDATIVHNKLFFSVGGCHNAMLESIKNIDKDATLDTMHEIAQKNGYVYEVISFEN